MDIVCPSCGERGSIESPGVSSVAVAVCLNCGEVIVIYRRHAVALDRSILANGSLEEKRRHVAAMILEFVRHNKPLEQCGQPQEGRSEPVCAELVERQWMAETMPLIGDREAEDFRRIDLNLIDKRVYFERMFGTGDE